MPRISIEPLTDAAARLKEAFDRSGLDRDEVIERIGVNRNTLKSHLNGHSGYKWEWAERYGRVFRVRPEWLLYGEGSMAVPPRSAKRPPREVPFISWVSAGHLIDTHAIHEEPSESTLVSDLPEGEYFVTEVRGDSMDRVSPDGSRILVRADDRHLVSGAFYVFSRRGEATYKRYQGRPVARLEPYSTNPANEPIFLGDLEEWEVVGRVWRSWIDLQ